MLARLAEMASPTCECTQSQFREAFWGLGGTSAGPRSKRAKYPVTECGARSSGCQPATHWRTVLLHTLEPRPSNCIDHLEELVPPGDLVTVLQRRPRGLCPALDAEGAKEYVSVPPPSQVGMCNSTHGVLYLDSQSYASVVGNTHRNHSVQDWYPAAVKVDFVVHLAHVKNYKGSPQQ